MELNNADQMEKTRNEIKLLISKNETRKALVKLIEFATYFPKTKISPEKARKLLEKYESLSVVNVFNDANEENRKIADFNNKLLRFIDGEDIEVTLNDSFFSRLKDLFLDRRTLLFWFFLVLVCYSLYDFFAFQKDNIQFSTLFMILGLAGLGIIYWILRKAIRITIFGNPKATIYKGLAPFFGFGKKEEMHFKTLQRRKRNQFIKLIKLQSKRLLLLSIGLLFSILSFVGLCFNYSTYYHLRLELRNYYSNLNNNNTNPILPSTSNYLIIFKNEDNIEPVTSENINLKGTLNRQLQEAIRLGKLPIESKIVNSITKEEIDSLNREFKNLIVVTSVYDDYSLFVTVEDKTTYPQDRMKDLAYTPKFGLLDSTTVNALKGSLVSQKDSSINIDRYFQKDFIREYTLKTDVPKEINYWIMKMIGSILLKDASNQVLTITDSNVIEKYNTINRLLDLSISALKIAEQNITYLYRFGSIIRIENKTINTGSLYFDMAQAFGAKAIVEDKINIEKIGGFNANLLEKKFELALNYAKEALKYSNKSFKNSFELNKGNEFDKILRVLGTANHNLIKASIGTSFAKKISNDLAIVLQAFESNKIKRLPSILEVEQMFKLISKLERVLNDAFFDVEHSMNKLKILERQSNENESNLTSLFVKISLAIIFQQNGDIQKDKRELMDVISTNKQVVKIIRNKVYLMNSK